MATEYRVVLLSSASVNSCRNIVYEITARFTPSTWRSVKKEMLVLCGAFSHFYFDSQCICRTDLKVLCIWLGILYGPPRSPEIGLCDPEKAMFRGEIHFLQRCWFKCYRLYEQIGLLYLELPAGDLRDRQIGCNGRGG